MAMHVKSFQSTFLRLYNLFMPIQINSAMRNNYRFFSSRLDDPFQAYEIKILRVKQ